jgi:hypothetical protein
MRARVLTWADRGSEAARLDPGQGFYVSVNDGDEHGLLVGPFDRLEEALGMLERAQTVAESVASPTASAAPPPASPGCSTTASASRYRPAAEAHLVSPLHSCRSRL